MINIIPLSLFTWITRIIKKAMTAIFTENTIALWILKFVVIL